MDIIHEEKIPYAPKDTRINRNNIFKILKISTIVKTMLLFLKATNIAPVNTKNRLKTTKTTNNTAKIGFASTVNSGEKMSIFKTKIKLVNTATIPVKEKQVLITIFFFLDKGRYLINDILKPNKDNITIS